MRCNLTKMRTAGVVVPKYELRELAQSKNVGDLAIYDTRENNLNRNVKVAKFTRYLGERRTDELLYEPHLLWMSETKFVITGFEQLLVNGKLTDYAQSWLCEISLPQVDDGGPRFWQKRETIR
jgi:hypothetical protein